MGCVAERVACRSGEVVMVVCEEPSSPGLLAHRLVKPSVFRGLAPGSLSTAFEQDWSRAYFIYPLPGGGGFYLEGHLDAFDDPSCAAEAAPRLLALLRDHGVATPANQALLEQLITRRIFTPRLA